MPSGPPAPAFFVLLQAGRRRRVARRRLRLALQERCGLRIDLLEHGHSLVQHLLGRALVRDGLLEVLALGRPVLPGPLELERKFLYLGGEPCEILL
jgi:hypothetical protein